MLQHSKNVRGSDPDDSVPWAWGLEPDFFQLDTDWDGLLEELEDRGPAAE